ncbi:beta-ketoacyl-[acyl-carrier-protein] synthase family protein [Saccharothrix algeriensis]|uniref:3-oxoacyl-[acyl-carrier-protein] synthase II n=1 Tax=Saccharothrix algeriensis TaxID=173560 RepID=A0ABS2S0U9_9PSEU|nr:beta-ketoacyl-[acyl-carrier-protein] synthase family protein [Saccharothrix algeriensis]MBM7809859.1 3-oxoacyl-[acyl-carrier-protein] synthase II [Saccharothrix algeriensis]
MRSGFAAVVTGLGVVSPAGHGVADNWAAVVRGDPVAAAHPDLAGLPVDVACRVPAFDAARAFGAQRARGTDRYAQLALLAAREAVADSRLDTGSWDAARVAVVLGTAAAGTATAEEQQARLLDRGAHRVSAATLPMALSNVAAARVAMEFGARGPSLSVSTACASGATAIGVGRDLLRTGTVDVVIAGAADAAVTPLYIGAFHRMRALSRGRPDPSTASRPFDRERDGFVLGEGAGVLVLETERHAAGRGARVLGSVRGHGATCDAHHITAPDPEGTGAEQAMRAALRDAGVDAREVGYVNAHGTSTRLNDAVEAAVVHRVLGGGAAVSSTKGVIGHPLGAAGAIEAVYCVLALREGRLPPTANFVEGDPGMALDLVTGAARDRRTSVALSNSFGFGGHNAVLLFTSE